MDSYADRSRDDLIAEIQQLTSQIRELENERERLSGAEDELRKNVAVFQHLVEHAEDIPYSLTRDGRITYLGRQVGPLLGLDPQKAVNTNYIDYVHEEDRKSVLAQIEKVFSGSGSAAIEFRLRDVTPEVWLENRGTVLKDDNGNTVGLTGVLRDVTQRHIAEQRLRESENRFRSVVESSPMGIHLYRLEPDDRLIFTGANQAADEILGVDHSQFVGKTIEEAFPSIVGSEVPERYSELCRHGGIWTTEQINYEDERIKGAFQVHAFQTAPNHMATFFLEITERLQARQVLSESEERFRNVVERAGEGIIVVQDAVIRYANPAIAEMLGYSQEQLTNQPFVHYVHPTVRDHVVETYRRRMAGEDAPPVYESMLIHGNGSTVHVEINGNQIQFDGHMADLVFLRDITARKESEQRIARVEGLLKAAFEQTQAGILVADAPDVRIRLANPAALGIRDDDSGLLTDIPIELHPERWQVLYPDGTPYDAEDLPLSRAVMKGEVVANAEAIIVRPDGEKRWVLANAMPVKDKDGTTMAGVVVFSDVTDRKIAQEALKQKSSELQTILDAMPALVFYKDRHNNIVRVNRAVADSLGVTPEEMAGTPTAEWWPEDADEYYKDDKLVIESGKPKLGIVERLDLGGAEKAWIETDKFPHFDENGDIIGVIVFVRDISDRRKAEESLRASEERYRLLFETAGDAIFLMDGERFIGCNSKTVELFGRSREEIVGCTPVELSTPMQPNGRSSQECAREMITRVCRGERVSFEWQHIRRDGTPFDAEVSLSQVPLAGATVIQAIVRDITERKLAEAKLKESGERLELALRGGSLGLWDWHIPSGAVIFNERWAEMLGYKLDELEQDVGTWEQLMHPDDKEHTMRALQEHLDGHTEFYRSEHRLRAKNGEWRWILDQGKVVSHDERGNPLRATGTHLDVTETRRLQELTERAQRMESAGRIAGQVAHDFNNLLGPLMAYPELLRDSLQHEPGSLKLLYDMQNAATQIAEINQQLLTLGRRGHYVMEPLNINAIVEQVLEQHRPWPESILLKKRLSSNLLNVRGGGAQLLRVIANLISNALDSMTSVGQLTVTTENFYAEGIAGNLADIPTGEYVKLTISDTGTGIRPELMHRIFEPFVTTKKADKKRGSGLGLSVVHSVVKDHDGFIDCESRVGQGTSFYLYLPITRDAARGGEDYEPQGGDELLLVVDDDRQQREVSALLLSRLGYTVETVASGEEALARVMEKTYGLVLLDMIMPGGMDGAQTYERIIAVNPDQRAILVSGFAENDRVEEALKLGAINFVQKPLTVNSIGRAVRQAIDAKIPSNSSVDKA